jgi:hypothetical protein
LINSLKFFGWILIICGMISAITFTAQIDWQHYNITKSVADELSTNELALQLLNSESASVFNQLQMAIMCFFSCFISPLL